MPMKPMSPCRMPGCPNLQVPGGRGYCKEHIKAYRKDEDKRRGSAHRRGYNKQYERARAYVLKHEPLCVVCKTEGRLTPATLTHHVEHLADGGSNRTDNLMPLCERCHGRMHSFEGPELLKQIGFFSSEGCTGTGGVTSR
ncbi:HNH endonuclease [Sporotomaculum syntrophicum]|nr:HNH endonuclease [Sporotomaculum syntrophicum]